MDIEEVSKNKRIKQIEARLKKERLQKQQQKEFKEKRRKEYQAQFEDEEFFCVKCNCKKTIYDYNIIFKKQGKKTNIGKECKQCKNRRNRDKIFEKRIKEGF